jgi:hypothetical protein
VLAELLVGLLQYGVFPLWVAAGFGDYCCHRLSRIEQTTGRIESSLHAVQYLQVVAGVALVLYFDVTSLVLALTIALALAHLVTGYLDIAYTTGRRYISPPEQHAHSYMEALPLVATALVVILYWDAFASIFNGEPDSWTLTRRQQPLPAAALGAVAVGFALAGLAIVEEYVRCARVGRAKTHRETRDGAPLGPESARDHRPI